MNNELRMVRALERIANALERQNPPKSFVNRARANVLARESQALRDFKGMHTVESADEVDHRARAAAYRDQHRAENHGDGA